MEKDIALYSRDSLRGAREAVQRNSEAFLDIIHVVERLGLLLLHESGGSGSGLGMYENHLNGLARGSPVGSRTAFAR